MSVSDGAQSHPTPAREPCEFRFIADPVLRDRLQHRYRTIRGAFDMACYPLTILFAGQVIETVLLDGLSPRWAYALASPKAPKGNSDIDSWELANLLAVALDLGFVPGDVEKLRYSVIHWRGLLSGSLPNPGIEVWKEEARIAIEVLLKIHRWLS
jgi:hypothetical protein